MKNEIMPARPLCFGAAECPTSGILRYCNHRDECIGIANNLRRAAQLDAKDALIKVLFRENAIHTESHNMLREIAAQDHDTFQPEDRLEIQPTFELVCKIAEHFGQDGQCAVCGPHTPKPVVCVDPGRPSGDETVYCMVLTKRSLETIAGTIVEGLNSVGDHHKQYHLEEALRLLVPNEFAECKESWGWEDGIPG